ncbi:insulinase family protein [Sphingomonas sp. LB-2]|uniref:M16 family metallopeptidase n=1 Tax=Sphingomonas caeni TaxID=2984949 RepID=UPI00222FFA86|nr:M16 family metallopeptidase [Sphingomonas caeni]MCW3847996.1 insulinase family protein [Sphingomonas caeni]
MFPYLSRLPRFALLALSVLGLAVPALAQVAPQAVPAAAPTSRPVQTADDPWLYKGSDIVQDTAWRFGRLPNGVRYAVRKNGVPPGQISVRVRIDAGSLMETDSERGFAHLLEHLSFRSSEFVPDGDSKRIWQRLGVTFGSDSNAQTTFTQTVYKLDLPNATTAGFDESMKILGGMMYGPALSQADLNAERPVVLAEAREIPGPQSRMQDAMFGLMFAGQPVAVRKPIGTTEALNAATPETVKAFHDRWYRPERAVVIVVGDMDPAQLEAMVVKHFSGWQGKGPAPKSPDFGKPEEGHPVSASLVEPTIPPMALITVVRPWTVFADTVIFNQERMVDLVALRIINRRLETRARAGASFLAAGANLDDIARSANVTTVQILPSGDNWETALKDVREVIADAQANPPTQAEIDRELAEIESAMKNRIATAPVESGVSLADDLVEAVDINETMTTPEGSYAIFAEAKAKGMFNPAAVQASSKRVFQGTATRALLNTHKADASTVTKLSAAISAEVTAATKRRMVGNVSFDQLPKLGAASAIVSRTTVLDSPKVEKVVFANGVVLLVHENASEVSKVYVNVRFGRGLQGLPSTRQTPAWAAPAALVASGIGTYGQEELDALTGSRTMGLDFAVGDDAFTFSGQTTKEDLADQLKLFATKLAAPSWDPNPVNRARAAMLSGYAGMSASPDAVLGRDLDALLHSGDPRWGTPPKATIAALNPASFRKLWEPLLASGPIEVEVFGDLDTEATIKAVGATFGALKPRTLGAIVGAPARFPAHVATPVVRYHTGQPDQAAAVIAWPTGGGTANNGITESRRLEILAAIFRDRLIDKLRSEAGLSYSPMVLSDWPLGMPGGGKMMAVGMLPPDKTGFFFELARSIAADLVANPVSRDELDRAINPLRSLIIRQSSGNMFWMRLVEGGAFDPARIAAVETLPRDISYATPAQIQALAAKYFVPAKDWTMVVLPEKRAGR